MSDQPIAPPPGMEMPSRKRYVDYRVEDTFMLDGHEVPFEPGQSIMNAALAAGHYIPHLCHNPEFKPFGSCKICTVKVNGWPMASCTTPAAKAARRREQRSRCRRRTPQNRADVVHRGESLLPVLR